MSEGSLRRLAGSRARLIAVSGVVASLCALSLAGDAFAVSGASPAAKPTDVGTGKPTSTSAPATTSTSAPASTTSTAPVGTDAADVLPADGKAVVISGTVTEAGTGQPLAGVCVGPFQWYDPSPECASTEVSDTSGRYRRTLQVPVYAGADGRVWAQPAASDDLHLEVASPLTLTDADSYTVDFSVPQAGIITGRAYDAATRKPLAGACPQVRGLDRAAYVGVARATCSDANGVWKLARVPVTDVAVALMGDATHQASYVPKGSLLAKAARATVLAGRTITVSDTSLEAGGTLSVSTDLVGRGVNEIVLHPVLSSQDLVVDEIVSHAGDDLTPIATNVQEGSYLVEVRNVWDAPDCSDDVDVCSDLATWWAPGTFDPGEAKVVKVRAGSETSLKAGMRKYRKLYLKLLDQLDRKDLGVEVFLPSGDIWDLDDTGYLPPVPVKLRLTFDDGKNREQWWVGGTSFADATPIDETTKRIDVHRVKKTTKTSKTKTSKTSKTKTSKTKTSKTKTSKTKTKAA